MASLNDDHDLARARADALRQEVELLRGTVAALRTARRRPTHADAPPMRVVPFSWVVGLVVIAAFALACATRYVVAHCS